MPEDLALKKALFRYQVISPLLAMDISRGEKMKRYRELADKEWVTPGGKQVRISVEAIRRWLRCYKKEGFEGLKDSHRSSRGGRIPQEAIVKACQLKQQVAERSIDKIITIMEDMGFAEEGLLKRSTLHRHLKERGLSARRVKAPDRKDLARWQAEYANDLWQSDMLGGPYLPDPLSQGTKRKTWLYGFLDDASRLMPYGRFFFKGDLPALELVFKRSIQRCGRPRAVYYDNGLVYRAEHMERVCAELGIHKPIFTSVRRPQGHGKIEAWNAFCTTNFLAELKDSHITTLEDLNKAFLIWVEYEYNRRRHSELGCTPRERWQRDAGRFRYVNEEKLRTVFLWREERRVDKCAMIQLFTRRYRVSTRFCGRKVEVRYNPEHLEVIEIWSGGKFQERVHPFVTRRRRPPREVLPPSEIPEPAEKTDYLGFLVKSHEAGDDSPRPGEEFLHREELSAVDAFVELFRNRVAAEVFDEQALRDHWARCGPLDLVEVAGALENMLADCPADLHISFYLDRLQKGDSL
ncbi:MAG: Mu transposase C-terminal domain-containing protein [Candidatus Eremiobacteraeota bacterium]|nr:Mu transposase C-terminal domain-containing protein [Candidatus Eremiobacteraeota bacterium]